MAKVASLPRQILQAEGEEDTRTGATTVVNVAVAVALEVVATTWQASSSSKSAKGPPNQSARSARRLVVKLLNAGTGTMTMNKTRHKLQHMELTPTVMLIVEPWIMSPASLSS